MAKARRRTKTEAPTGDFDIPRIAVPGPFKPRTQAQSKFESAIRSCHLTFATGPAGTGKTYVAASLAAEALTDDPSLKLILTRPAVEAGEEMGFLPGDLNEKYAPYLTPFFQVLEERLSPGTVKYLLKVGRIVPRPLAYMRGMTFRDCWVILDEAQNTTPTQMKLFLTRIGVNSKVIVDGDLEQVDIRGISGLDDAVRRLADIPGIRHIEFSDSDIVRHGLVRQIISAYRG
jgi:phosphate starvation-inducible PhoH-like protein